VIVLGIMFFSFMNLLMVNENEFIILERLGKYHSTLTTGLNILIPFIDNIKTVRWTQVTEDPRGRTTFETKSMYRIPRNELLFDFPKLNVLTRDHLLISINGMLFYQIVDPKKALYQVDDLLQGLQQLTQTYLRDAISQLTVDEAIRDKQKIQHLIFKSYAGLLETWGIRVTRFDIQQLDPPANFTDVQTKLAIAKTQSEAEITRSRTEEQIKIIRTESELRDRELRATSTIEIQKRESEASAYKVEREAKSRATANQMIAEAELDNLKQIMAAGLGTEYLLQKEYTKAWASIASNPQTKFVVIPYESAKFLGSSCLSMGQDQTSNNIEPVRI